MNKMNFKSLAVLAFVAVMLVASSNTFAQGGGAKSQGAAVKMMHKTDLRLGLRDLWEGHIFWVRNVVVSTKVGDTGEAKVADEQAVQNAKEIANAIVPYYGKDAGDKLFTLLAGHYGAIKDYMNATYGGKKDAVAAARDKLLKNVDEIATFLSSANPKNWPKDTLVSALTAHVGHHMAQIEQINSKDFAGEAKTWEAMKKHMDMVADVLAEGIVKQFPQKFSKGAV